MNMMETLLSRKSVREYTGEPVTKEELDQILLAANAAPVGMAKYDEVHLTVISKKELLDEIEKGAQEMFHAPDIRPLYGAPTLVLVSAKLADPAAGNVAYSNAAIIVHNMALAATELGVGVVHIWGAVAALAANPSLTAKLGLPEGFVPCCAAAIGKTGYIYERREVPMERIATDYID